MVETCITELRKRRPLIHNITNYVTANGVANGILACGGRPIMADEPEEACDITSLCDGLNINIGTLNRNSIEAMFIAGKTANELKRVVLLDPVGVGASKLRVETVRNLIKEVKFDVIRGNVTEIKILALENGVMKGVDANIDDMITEKNLDEMVKFVKGFAQKTCRIIAITGEIDLVSDGCQCYVIRNGTQEMSDITGMGCLLSGIMTAFVSANPHNKFVAAAAAVCTVGLAGEIGFANMQNNEGNSSLHNRIIDAIYNMDETKLRNGAKYELR